MEGVGNMIKTNIRLIIDFYAQLLQVKFIQDGVDL